MIHAFEVQVRQWLDSWWHDLLLTARQLKRARGFTIVAVLTLGLGIGADAAVFAALHRMLLDPLPFPNGNRIVELMETYGGGQILFPPDSVLIDAWAARAHTLDDFAVAKAGVYHASELATTDSLAGAAVTPGFMRMVNVRPRLGREFVAADAEPGAPAVAIIGYGLWQQAYGGAHDALGATIHVNGRAYSIVGVAPRDMAVPMADGTPPSIWLPLARDSMRGGYNVYARLRDRISVDDASHELEKIMATLPNAARYAHAGARDARPGLCRRA